MQSIQKTVDEMCPNDLLLPISAEILKSAFKWKWRNHNWHKI